MTTTPPIPDFSNPQDWVLVDINGQVPDPENDEDFVIEDRPPDDLVASSSQLPPEGLIDDYDGEQASPSSIERTIQLVAGVAAAITPSGSDESIAGSTPPLTLTFDGPAIPSALFTSAVAPTPPLQQNLSPANLSSHFPQAIIDIIGAEDFSKLPVCDLSNKKISDIREEDLNASFALFYPSSEGYSGFIKLSKLFIGIYYGSAASAETWQHIELPLKKIKKTRAHLERLDSQISSAGRGEKRNNLNMQKSTHKRDYEAMWTPSPLSFSKLQQIFKK